MEKIRRRKDVFKIKTVWLIDGIIHRNEVEILSAYEFAFWFDEPVRLSQKKKQDLKQKFLNKFVEIWSTIATKKKAKKKWKE